MKEQKIEKEQKMKEEFLNLLRKVNRDGIEDIINFLEKKTMCY